MGRRSLVPGALHDGEPVCGPYIVGRVASHSHEAIAREERSGLACLESFGRVDGDRKQRVVAEVVQLHAIVTPARQPAALDCDLPALVACRKGSDVDFEVSGLVALVSDVATVGGEDGVIHDKWAQGHELAGHPASVGTFPLQVYDSGPSPEGAQRPARRHLLGRLPLAIHAPRPAAGGSDRPATNPAGRTDRRRCR